MKIVQASYGACKQFNFLFVAGLHTLHEMDSGTVISMEKKELVVPWSDDLKKMSYHWFVIILDEEESVSEHL